MLRELKKWGHWDSNPDLRLASGKSYFIAFQLNSPLLEAPIVDNSY